MYKCIELGYPPMSIGHLLFEYVAEVQDCHLVVQSHQHQVQQLQEQEKK